MNQHAEAALRGALERVTEGLDDNPERYDQVEARSRRRRHRHLVEGVAAAAAVLLVTGSAIVATGALRTAGAEPAGGPLEIDCPQPVDQGNYDPTAAPQDAGPLVPEHPVAIRVCGLDDRGREPAVDITLEQGLSRLVTALNALPAPSGEWMCTQEMGNPPYHLVLPYADGTQVTVLVEPGNCRSVIAGDQVRVQPRTNGQITITGLVYELAENQRWLDAPADPTDPTCPDPRTLTLPRDDHPVYPWFEPLAWATDPDQTLPYPAAAVAACRYDSTDPQTARLITERLVADGAERARGLVNGLADLERTVDSDGARCDPPAGWWDVLVFADAAGGRYEVRVGRGECEFIWSKGLTTDARSPELDQWLDKTLGEEAPR